MAEIKQFLLFFTMQKSIIYSLHVTELTMAANSQAFLIEFKFKLFIFNFASSSFEIFTELYIPIVFIGFRLSSSNFCQVWEKFNTQIAFIEIEFKFEFGKKERVQRIRVSNAEISIITRQYFYYK